MLRAAANAPNRYRPPFWDVNTGWKWYGKVWRGQDWMGMAGIGMDGIGLTRSTVSERLPELLSSALPALLSRIKSGIDPAVVATDSKITVPVAWHYWLKDETDDLKRINKHGNGLEWSGGERHGLDGTGWARQGRVRNGRAWEGERALCPSPKSNLMKG